MAHHTHSGGHESKDVKLRGLILSMVVLALTIVAIQLILGLWMAVYIKKEKAIIQENPAAVADTAFRFPAPELQGNPGADMNKFLDEEAQSLADYGWVDQSQHIARIPIDRGIDAVVAHGFKVYDPARTVAPAAEPAPTQSEDASK